MTDTPPVAVDAIIKILGAVLAAAAGAGTTYFLSHRRVSDRKALIFVRTLFNRPAFRGPFSWQTDPKPHERAIELTIKALNTGVLQDRSGTEIRRGPAVSDIHRNSWRLELEDVSFRLKQILNDIDRYLQAGASDAKASSRIDSERDEVVRIVNSLLLKARLEPLPLPSTCQDASATCEPQ